MMLAIDWTAVSTVAGVLGMFGGLTIAGVAVYRARTERRADLATVAGKWALQMLELLPTAILRVASDDRITYANEQARLMTKYRERELVGMVIHELLPPRFRKQHPGFTRGFRNSPRTRPMGAAGVELYLLDKLNEETRVVIFLKQMEPIDNGPETLVMMWDFEELVKMIKSASLIPHHIGG